MTVLVNGAEAKLAAESSTLADLLAQLGYSAPVFVVQVNGALVERPAYPSAQLSEGDLVDIFNLFDGG
jgi:thiamine biosynthesis protein ThiS